MRAVHMLGAFNWEPQIHGTVVIILAVVLLPGTVYLVLSTDLGARLGLVVALAGLAGWMAVMAIVWAVYGIGLKGRAPEWKAQEVVQGSTARATTSELSGFPRGWERADLADPKVSEALAAADGALSGEGKPYEASSGYVPIGAYDKGGEAYGPLGLDFRPFDFLHKPHHFVLQVQGKADLQENNPNASTTPFADPAKPVSSVVMIRDLGAVRQPAVVVAVASSVIFALCCWVLHRRDKEAMRLRAEAAAT